MTESVDKNEWPNKPLTDLIAWMCIVVRAAGFIIAGYGLYLVKLQVTKGDLYEAMEVTLASFLSLVAFHFIIHSSLCQAQQIVARKVYGYLGDDKHDERLGLMLRAVLYAIVIFFCVYLLLQPH